jgi:hypothetical protein
VPGSCTAAAAGGRNELRTSDPGQLASQSLAWAICCWLSATGHEPLCSQASQLACASRGRAPSSPASASGPQGICAHTTSHARPPCRCFCSWLCSRPEPHREQPTIPPAATPAATEVNHHCSWTSRAAGIHRGSCCSACCAAAAARVKPCTWPCVLSWPCSSPVPALTPCAACGPTGRANAASDATGTCSSSSPAAHLCTVSARSGDHAEDRRVCSV